MRPQRPLPEGWEPHITTKRDLHARFGSEVDLALSLEKFRAFHTEGQTSRDWDARFRVWVYTDVQRVRERRQGGTDDLGAPLGQSTPTSRPLGPEDPGYVDPEDLATEAVRLAEAHRDEC